MSTASEQIQLTPEQQERVALLAEQTGKPWEQVLGEALNSFEQSTAGAVQRQESVYDAMLRHGFLGCVDDAPADLSTNPAYLEGYGDRDR